MYVKYTRRMCRYVHTYIHMHVFILHTCVVYTYFTTTNNIVDRFNGILKTYPFLRHLHTYVFTDIKMCLKNGRKSVIYPGTYVDS